MIKMCVGEGGERVDDVWAELPGELPPLLIFYINQNFFFQSTKRPRSECYVGLVGNRFSSKVA